MNRLYWLAILTVLVVLILSAGCTKVAEPGSGGPDQGIEVGNARYSSYYSSEYKFRVSYLSSMKFRSVSEEEFSISNEPTANSALISSTLFNVFPAGHLAEKAVDSLEALHVYLKEKKPELKFIPSKIGTVPGFVHREEKEAKVEALYYLFTPRGDVVSVSVDAFAENEGIRNILPVVESFTFDDRSPAINRFQLLGSSIVSGPAVNFTIHSTDDLSGVRNQVRLHLVPLNTISAPGFIDGFFETTRPLIALADDFYSFQLLIPKTLKSGEYLIRKVTVWDRIGNRTTAVTPMPGENAHNLVLAQDEVLAGFQPVVITVSHTGSGDVVPPVITEMKINTKTLPTGSTGSLLVRVNDDNPLPTNFRTRLEIRRVEDPDNSIQPLHIKTEAVPLEDGWYAIKFDVGLYLLAGKYFVYEARVEDKAGNIRRLSASLAKGFYEGADGINIPIAYFNISEASNVDIDPPLVTGLRMSKSEIVQGGNAKILFQATDNLSGVSDFIGFAGTVSIDFDLPGSIPSKKASFGGAVKTLPGDWYSIDFEIPDSFPVGTCFLQALLVTDRAGNIQKVRLPPTMITRPMPESAVYENTVSPIKIIKFKVLPKVQPAR